MKRAHNASARPERANPMKSLILAALAACLAVPAWAQNNCAKRTVVLERLADRFGEVRRVVGLDARGGLVEIYGNTKTGTWTMAVTAPNGITCLVAAGRHFEVIAGEVKDGDPA